jgi:hypothetical protein
MKPEPNKRPLVRLIDRVLTPLYDFLTRISGVPIAFASAANPRPDPSWREWCHYGTVLRRPGWALCRFAVRDGSAAGGLRFVTGFVRGAFGLWSRPIANGVVMVQSTVLAHGCDFTAFADFETAAMASEIADKMIDWSLHPVVDDDGDLTRQPDAAWMDELIRAFRAWDAAEIRPAFQVQKPDGSIFAVMKHQPEPIEGPQRVS